jgi:hypothetical protein
LFSRCLASRSSVKASSIKLLIVRSQGREKTFSKGERSKWSAGSRSSVSSRVSGSFVGRVSRAKHRRVGLATVYSSRKAGVSSLFVSNPSPPRHMQHRLFRRPVDNAPHTYNLASKREVKSYRMGGVKGGNEQYIPVGFCLPSIRSEGRYILGTYYV